MEEMQYTPSIKLCLVTRGTLLNGKRSRACIWSAKQLVQITKDGRHYFGRDTYDHQNPFIYQRQHLMDHADGYIKKLQSLFSYHFDDLPKYIKRKRLKGTITTTLQEFDCCEHRHVFSTFYAKPTKFGPIWDSIVQHQAVK